MSTLEIVVMFVAMIALNLSFYFIGRAHMRKEMEMKREREDK